MRNPRTTIAVIAVAAALGVSGIAAALAAGGSTTAGASSKTGSAATTPVVRTVVPAASATIRTLNARVDGTSEAILVDHQGLPLYIYKPDTATMSFVSGGLAALWPPLDSTSPTVADVTGKLSVTHDANGAQVAYNGHFLYTFAEDSPGHVTGQGVENFFVATPGLTALGAGSSAPSTPAPAASSVPSYGY